MKDCSTLKSIRSCASHSLLRFCLDYPCSHITFPIFFVVILLSATQIYIELYKKSEWQEALMYFYLSS